MTKRIKLEVEDVDIQLKTLERNLTVFGKIVLSFYCQKCHQPCKSILRYERGNPKPTYNNYCGQCGETYLITNTISISPEIQGREGVKLDRQMKPIIERIKQRKKK